MLTTWQDAATVGRVPVLGGSMRPLFDEGASLRVHGGLEARFGDVVVAVTPAGLVVHRVVSRGSQGVRLRGDDTPATDRPVDPRAVLGRVTAVEGLRGRRVDRGPSRWIGIGAAAYARLQMALNDRPPRPRPSAFVSAGLALERGVFPPMAPEDGLLLCLSRLKVGEEAGMQAHAFAASGLNWDLVVRRALLGQLGPLVDRAVHELGDLVVPEAAGAELRRQSRGSAIRSLDTARLTAAVLERLGAAGIAVMAHKGVALAATVYPEPALRIAGDIDLSVRDEDRARAEEIVADLRADLVRTNPDRRDPRGHHIELDGTAHHDIDPSEFGRGRWAARTFDWEGIWNRALPAEVAGYTALVPAPTDLLLTLVANSVRRGFSPVRVVADIAATVHHHGSRIDWNAFEAASLSSRLNRRAWIALGLAADWFAADVPARLLEPPVDLRMAVYERGLVGLKWRRPFLRLPTRVLWAGSAPAAAAAAWRSARAEWQRRGPSYS